MSTRETIVTELGTMLEQAARSSVARGAAYEPGESINLDSGAAWKIVAETLVNLVNVTVDNRIPRDKQEKTDVDAA